jgi:hypothetical protein
MRSDLIRDDDVEIDIDEGDDDNDVDSVLGDDPNEEEESPYCDPPPGCVRLRPSLFRGIPATVFVEYPPELGIVREDASVIEPLGLRRLGYKSHWERICVKNAHVRAGFFKSEHYWTSLWSKHQNAEQMRGLNCLQKVNHFPASWCVGRKDRLSRTLNTMKRIHPGPATTAATAAAAAAVASNNSNSNNSNSNSNVNKSGSTSGSGSGSGSGGVYDFHPETFTLPPEREPLHRLLRLEISAGASAVSSGRKMRSFNCPSNSAAAQGGLWIVKPSASSCGRGISVMTGQQVLSLPKRRKVVVQRYLARPYLIDGKKFDLRIYVLVAGVDPLRVYIHDEGLTRISTAKYSTHNIANNFAHLTNYSINKAAPNFRAAAFNSAPGSGARKATQAGTPQGDGAPGGEEEWEGADGGPLDVREQQQQQFADATEAMQAQALDPDMEGFKWSLAAFRRWLSRREGRPRMEQTFDRIFDLCLKTMIAAEGEITPHLHRYPCHAHNHTHTLHVLYRTMSSLHSVTRTLT